MLNSANQIQTFKVFPNPVYEQIWFELLSDELLQSHFEIHDIQGKNYSVQQLTQLNFQFQWIIFRVELIFINSRILQ